MRQLLRISLGFISLSARRGRPNSSRYIGEIWLVVLYPRSWLAGSYYRRKFEFSVSSDGSPWFDSLTLDGAMSDPLCFVYGVTWNVTCLMPYLITYSKVDTQWRPIEHNLSPPSSFPPNLPLCDVVRLFLFMSFRQIKSGLCAGYRDFRTNYLIYTWCISSRKA